MLWTMALLGIGTITAALALGVIIRPTRAADPI